MNSLFETLWWKLETAHIPYLDLKVHGFEPFVCVLKQSDFFHFFQQTMKALTVILLLVFCGIASASWFRRQSSQCDGVPDNVAPGCDGASSPEQVCAENCGGALCKYYKSNDYPSSCVTLIASACESVGLKVLSACGALALVTIKGVLVAVLLLAAFFIL